MATATNENVVLILSKDEAQTLTEIMAGIGGSPKGQRRHADAIFDALQAIGFRHTDVLSEDFPFVMGEWLEFKD